MLIETRQTTNTVLMVCPARFRFNEQTAADNAMMQATKLEPAAVQRAVRAEFFGFANALRQAGVRVIIVPDDPERDTPDSIFPNNWVSFHEDGTIITYPMKAENRRAERREDLLAAMRERFGFTHRIHWEQYEEQGRFLEGTGSMILDRPNRLLFASLSERTDEGLVREYARRFGYEPVFFRAVEHINGRSVPYYHTNVMLVLGRWFTVAALESIPDQAEREEVESRLRETGREIVEISREQVQQFAGNMLELRGRGGAVLAMSSRAFHSLTKEQAARLKAHADIVHAPLTTIEDLGGGSARCMLAEIFVPPRHRSDE